MGNVSQLCNTSNIEYAANESLQTTILHNRKQSKQLPMVPTHILQQITRLLQKQAQAPQHLHTKIWEVHKPQHFYYFNESAYQDEAPLGLCTMYFFHPNNQFKGFFRGLIASSGLRENKGSVYVLGNGDYFIGDLHKTDYGTYISESDQYRYEGDWVCGKAHGLGVEVTKKGTYEGYFLEGKKHGKGKFHNQEGMTYEGEFRKNEMQGNGKYTNKAQNYEYIGSFKSGLRSGHGVQRCQQYEYEGTFINNCKSGSGKITYFDRKMEYEGEFQKNMPHGMGKIKFEDQTIEGVWVEGILKALFSTKQ